MTERTLILIKPDGVQRALIGKIVDRYEQRGLRIVGMKMLICDRALAEQHYDVHRGKPFFDGLIEYITASPIVAAVFEGSHAIKATRQTMGATNPIEAATGSIRADFGLDRGRNLTHASDSPESAKREIALFFGDMPPIAWKRDAERWLFE